MTEELTQAIRNLTILAGKQIDGAEAMRLSQAALNLAHVYLSVRNK